MVPAVELALWCWSDFVSFSWQCLHFLCGDSCVTVAFGQEAQLFIAHTSILAFHHLPAILWRVSSGIVAAQCVAGLIEAACSQTGDRFAHTPTPPRTFKKVEAATLTLRPFATCYVFSAHIYSAICVSFPFFLSLPFFNYAATFSFDDNACSFHSCCKSDFELSY